MSSFGPSPRDAPLTYPGLLPESSGLVTSGPFLPVELREHRRLPQARVILGEDRPGALVDVGQGRVTLGYALLALNAVPIEARFPVLAVGSNASIASMQAKFRAAGISPVMPLTWAAVTGVRVGVAALVSRWGYIPAAPVFDAAVTSRLAVNWLDTEQLRAIDETEVGYERRIIHELEGVTRVCLESGETLTECGVYVSRSGVWAQPHGPGDKPASGDPARRHSAGGLAEGGQPLELVEQSALIKHLLERADPGLRAVAGRTVAGFLEAASNDERRSRLTELLRSSPRLAVVHGDDPTTVGELRRYGASRLGLPPPDGVPDALRVAPSPDDTDRTGEPALVLSPNRWEALGRPTHAVVRSCMDPHAPAAVGRVLNDALRAAEVQIDHAEVQIDQAVRNAIGVEVGEHVTVEAAAIRRHPVADAFLSTPYSLLCRVQQADLMTSERRVALLGRLPLNLVGVEGGERVVIEGLPDVRSGTLRTVIVRAYEVSDEMSERRERLSVGGFEHLFPAARDALGVYPDLPWIFIDRALRTELGLTQPQLAVVRVRASRKDQVTKELREMLLVVVLAFIGLIAAFDALWSWVVGLLAAAAIVIGVVGLRLRSRLREG